MASQGVEGEHAQMRRQAEALATAAGKSLEDAIAEGQVSEQELFQPTYVDIPNTQPPKKTVGWDQLTDKRFPPLQEPLLSAGAAYAIVVNADGYCPTHNNKFCQPLTGDAAKDLAGNRTKRVFTDTVGQRCTKHEGLLVQTYLRDTGETMHDLSVPVYVKGRRWGAVRVGYVARAVAD
jgi:methyl-accepting chemotaxis protein